jgi:hypothetical protein
MRASQHFDNGDKHISADNHFGAKKLNLELFGTHKWPLAHLPKNKRRHFCLYYFSKSLSGVS